MYAPALTPEVREESEVPKPIGCSRPLGDRSRQEIAFMELSRKGTLQRDFGEVLAHSLLLSPSCGSFWVRETGSSRGSRPLPSFPTHLRERDPADETESAHQPIRLTPTPDSTRPRIFDLRSTFASQALAAGSRCSSSPGSWVTSVQMIERHDAGCSRGRANAIRGKLEGLRWGLGPRVGRGDEVASGESLRTSRGSNSPGALGSGSLRQASSYNRDESYSKNG